MPTVLKHTATAIAVAAVNITNGEADKEVLFAECGKMARTLMKARAADEDNMVVSNKYFSRDSVVDLGLDSESRKLIDQMRFLTTSERREYVQCVKSIMTQSELRITLLDLHWAPLHIHHLSCLPHHRPPGLHTMKLVASDETMLDVLMSESHFFRMQDFDHASHADVI